MRVNNSATVTASAVARSEVAKATPTLKSTAELPSAVSRPPVDGFHIAPGGCFPGPRQFPPFPPFPPLPRPGDANGRTQARQLHDIAEGVRNGSITPEEAQRLLKQQESVSKATEQAMADGKLTTEEKLKLQLMQAGADLNIYQAGHNNQRDFFAAFDSTAQKQASQIRSDRQRPRQRQRHRLRGLGAAGRAEGNRGRPGRWLGLRQAAGPVRAVRGGPGHRLRQPAG